MKMISFILALISTASGSVFCQSCNKTPIAITDIEKGILDFGYFRAELLEKGFK